MKIKLVKDKAPFKAPIQIYSKGAVVNNRFGGDSIELNALELSIYDTIIGLDAMSTDGFLVFNGITMANQHEEIQRGLNWFMKFNPKAYMVLLD
jgi:hypothetical protein